MDNQAAGATSNTNNRLVLDLAKGESRPVGAGPMSPILQLDGEAEEDRAKYSFVSMYAEEDIMYTLGEIFPKTEVRCTLESRERVAPKSAHHLCILDIEAITSGRSQVWPDMTADQAVVFEEVKKI